MHNEQNFCRVCGFESEDPPWGDDGTSASFEMCVCCGVEHGYCDVVPSAARAWRQKWIDKGCKWDIDSFRPENWDASKQMANIPEAFR